MLDDGFITLQMTTWKLPKIQWYSDFFLLRRQ